MRLSTSSLPITFMASNEILSREQFNALLAEAAKKVAPTEAKPVPIQARLKPHRKILLEYHRKGYSFAQLTEFLRTPGIAIEVSPSFLRKFLFTSPTKKATRTSQVTTVNATTAGAPASAVTSAGT